MVTNNIENYRPVPQLRQLQNHIINDFSETFERNIGFTMESCRDIVEDTYSIFYSFSYLIQHLFSIIDTVIPCETFTIKCLTVPQRRNFYVELSEVGIRFTKNKYVDDNHNHCTDICISTSDLWSVPDFRITPEIAYYQHKINCFNSFYSRVDNIHQSLSNGNISVSLEYFLEFKRIFFDAITSYNQILYNNHINNNLYLQNQQSYNTQHCRSKPRESSNNKIKHQLADLIFDIKDNLSDSMYKEILETISQIAI